MLELQVNLLEATRYFDDPEVCRNFVANMRWGTEAVCPHCKHDGASFLSTRKIWKCKSCKKQFSVKTGTIFEDSPLPLDKWLIGIWLIVNAKNGVSSCEVARALGVTQKTGWFLLHRVREALKEWFLREVHWHGRSGRNLCRRS